MRLSRNHRRPGHPQRRSEKRWFHGIFPCGRLERCFYPRQRRCRHDQRRGSGMSRFRKLEAMTAVCSVRFGHDYRSWRYLSGNNRRHYRRRSCHRHDQQQDHGSKNHPRSREKEGRPSGIRRSFGLQVGHGHQPMEARRLCSPRRTDPPLPSKPKQLKRSCPGIEIPSAAFYVIERYQMKDRKHQQAQLMATMITYYQGDPKRIHHF